MPWAWLASRLGKNDGAVHVVRRRALGLRTGLIVAEVLVGIFALYVVYELGRYDAGYDRQRVAQQRTELEVQIEKLEKSNREMRTQLAELDMFRVGRAREQAEVARTIGELQAQVERESQELAFYRGVVSQGAAEIGVKIGQVRLSAGHKTGQYVLHLALLRTGRPDNMASGTLELVLDGAGADGRSDAPLDLPALTGGKLHELPFNFRFFQNFDQEIAVPAGFKPEHLAVEVHSSRKDMAPLVQTFPWSLENAP